MSDPTDRPVTKLTLDALTARVRAALTDRLGAILFDFQAEEARPYESRFTHATDELIDILAPILADLAASVETLTNQLAAHQECYDACADYLKDGETPAECIERNWKDANAVVELLRQEKAKVETLAQEWAAERDARKINERLVVEFRERGDMWQADAVKAEAALATLRQEKVKVETLTQEQNRLDKECRGDTYELMLIEADTRRGITDCSTPLFQRVRNIVEMLTKAEAELATLRADYETLRTETDETIGRLMRERYAAYDALCKIRVDYAVLRKGLGRTNAGLNATQVAVERFDKDLEYWQVEVQQLTRERDEAVGGREIDATLQAGMLKLAEARGEAVGRAAVLAMVRKLPSPVEWKHLAALWQCEWCLTECGKNRHDSSGHPANGCVWALAQADPPAPETP